MLKIDSVFWGKVKIDGKEYHQALIIGEKVFERDKPKLKTLFGTSHEIGDWERELLFSGSPEIILIASGFSGVLKVSFKFQVLCSKLSIEMRTDLTPKAVAEYNRLVSLGRHVNALIHTTC